MVPSAPAAPSGQHHHTYESELAAMNRARRRMFDRHRPSGIRRVRALRVAPLCDRAAGSHRFMRDSFPLNHVVRTWLAVIGGAA